MKNTIGIAIDGPAAAGKSTVAKIVAEKLAYIYIDTGAMYRALTLIAINEGVGLEDEQALEALLKKATITLTQNIKGQQVFVNKVDVTEEIRSEAISNNVSHVAKHLTIRTEMVKRQQKLAEKHGVVMDGRDIGTHVLPNAEAKFFLIATVEERAKRRYEENKERGFTSNLEEIKQEIKQRDLIDSEREVSPLIMAQDAVEIDTTALSINQVADLILTKAREVMHKLHT